MSLRTRLITALGGAHPLYVQIAEDTVEKLTLANKRQEDQLHLERRLKNALLNAICGNEGALEDTMVQMAIKSHKGEPFSTIEESMSEALAQSDAEA